MAVYQIYFFFGRYNNIHRTNFDDRTPIHNGVMSVAEPGYKKNVLVSADWVDEPIDWTYTDEGTLTGELSPVSWKSRDTRSATRWLSAQANGVGARHRVPPILHTHPTLTVATKETATTIPTKND